MKVCRAEGCGEEVSEKNKNQLCKKHNKGRPVKLKADEEAAVAAEPTVPEPPKLASVSDAAPTEVSTETLTKESTPVKKEKKAKAKKAKTAKPAKVAAPEVELTKAGLPKKKPGPKPGKHKAVKAAKVPGRRGRPPGSKNKPKEATVVPITAAHRPGRPPKAVAAVVGSSSGAFKKLQAIAELLHLDLNSVLDNMAGEYLERLQTGYQALR